jgi:hypothetical protein
MQFLFIFLITYLLILGLYSTGSSLTLLPKDKHNQYQV